MQKSKTQTPRPARPSTAQPSAYRDKQKQETEAVESEGNEPKGDILDAAKLDMTRARLHPTRCRYCIRSFGVAHRKFIRPSTELAAAAAQHIVY